ncbi:MAG: YraN family protein [Betaproteobacteria bacterium HGW-Betaproteobacteria-22]|nr:MAG: YraN family protein [Betaproteobacteria bacterium HGW-Betaproteobacteria-22]
MNEKMKAKHLSAGINAEQLAATFLTQQGLTLVEKNFRCPYGEIDLIMREAKTLVFVEVRLRSSTSFGGASMSITASKQQKLTRTAERYLQTHGNTDCRFDVILMQQIDINAVEWIKNAF